MDPWTQGGCPCCHGRDPGLHSVYTSYMRPHMAYFRTLEILDIVFTRVFSYSKFVGIEKLRI